MPFRTLLSIADEDMGDDVKITVIATGFDIVASRGVPAAAVVTPTDMSSYSHLPRPEVEPARVATPVSSQSAPMPIAAVPVTRRAPLDLSLPLASAGAASAGTDAEGLDMSSPLDVPAFLRRHN